nr:hypothetical protein RNT25_04248 [arsenite-oxidising bacterium NT-25]
MVIFGFQLPIEPAGEVAQRLYNSLFTSFGWRLPGRAVARHVDAHAIFVVVAPAVGHLGVELIEVLPLSGLKTTGDAVQGLILRGVGADFARGSLCVSNRRFETGLMQSTA